ncbi:MAG TPA: hypothetical protein DCS93_36900 [Microscillaceae bacterium]|nr:hypothetical protein [Microscillaceae bacterium]
MSNYTIENEQINWEILINHLKNDPTDIDFRHFKAIVSNHWHQESTQDRLQADFLGIYLNLEQFNPRSQAFFLSFIFDYNIRSVIEKAMPRTFERLLKQDTTSDHHFLILRYFLAFQFQFLSPKPELTQLQNLLDTQPSSEAQAFVLTQINAQFGTNIYANPVLQQQGLELLQTYLRSSSPLLRYVTAFELLKSQRFQASEAIIDVVLEVFGQPSSMMQSFFNLYHTFKTLPKVSLTNQAYNDSSDVSEPPTPEVFFLTRHIQAFQLTGKTQYTYILPKLLQQLKPENQVDFIVEAIIQMGFGPISIRTQKRFTSLQEHILTVFATQPWLWQQENIREMLEAIEVPANEMELNILLSQQTEPGALPDFSKLYEVDWQNTSHAYGSATDVPQLLMKICVANVEVRKSAWWHLYGNLFHQGTRYPATVLAIPFFIELLDYEGVPDKHKILQYLTHCLLGYPEAYIHQPPNYEVDFFSTTYDEEGVQAGLYEAISKGISRYTKFLNEGNDEEKQAAIFLLAWFYPLKDKALPALKYFIEEEENPLIQANMLLAISYLTSQDDPKDWMSFFNQWLQAAEEDWLKLAAAIAIYRLGIQSQQAEVLPILLNFLSASLLKNEAIEEEDEGEDEEELIQPEDLEEFADGEYQEEAWLSFPWIDEAGNPETFIAGFFENLPTEQNQLVSQALLQKMKTGSLFESIELLRILLRLNFTTPASGKTQNFTQLDEYQRSVLQALTEIEQLWQVGNNSLIIKSYGLPTGLEDLKKFLANQ